MRACLAATLVVAVLIEAVAGITFTISGSKQKCIQEDVQKVRTVRCAKAEPEAAHHAAMWRAVCAARLSGAVASVGMTIRSWPKDVWPC